jgi:phosphoglycerate-specific signal transduction histidine kinase
MVIVGKTSILKRQIINGEMDQKAFIESLNKIERTTFRISTIINGLKTFSRDAGKDEFRDVKLAKIIDETLVLCQEKFWHKEINLEIKPVPNVTINCRQAQVIQVIINLLNNSIDAIKDLSERWVQISFEMKTIDKISIYITDSGKGIPEDVADKIMQPFFTTKEQGKGTGIALSISKGIMEEHQGQLYLDRNFPNTRMVVVFKAKIL